MAKFDQRAYIDAYNEENYDRLTVRLPAGGKAQLKERAQSKGLSVNAYILSLIGQDDNKEVNKMSKITINDREGVLSEEEKAEIRKWEEAKRISGWSRYPTTCSKIFSRIPPEWADRYTAQQLGEIAALLKGAYDDGVQFGRQTPEE